jgi:hypothetical protein
MVRWTINGRRTADAVVKHGFFTLWLSVRDFKFYTILLPCNKRENAAVSFVSNENTSANGRNSFAAFPF